MGHLVNPVSIRLGWVYSWENIYFCKNLYYPQMLHLIYKLKLFLLFCLRQYFLKITLGVLFSHFHFIQKGRFFYISIFTYQSLLEFLVQDFVLKGFWFVQNLIPNKQQYFNLIFAEKAVLFLLIYSVSCWHPNAVLNKLLMSIWPERLMTYLIGALNKKDFYATVQKFMYWKPLKIKYKARFLVMYRIFQQFLVASKFYWWDAVIGFCYRYFSSFGLAAVLKRQKVFFEIFAKQMFQLNIYVAWFRITNNEVKPAFLSWFLAYKFKQNFPLFSLVKAMKRELQQLMFFLNFRNERLKKKHTMHERFFFKVLLKKNCSHYLKCFHQEWYNFSIINKIWITYDYFLFLKRLHKRKMNNKKFYFYLRLCKFLGWIQIAAIRITSSVAKLIINKQPFYWYFNKIIVYYFNRDLIFNEFELNNFFKKYILGSVSLFHDFITSWWIENSNCLIIALQLNKLQLRENQINRQFWFGLAGFKFQFSGRFSRKQRAASAWVQHGRMPLNTIDAHIEYAMSSNIARNSTISVRIWFFYTNFLYSGFTQIL